MWQNLLISGVADDNVEAAKAAIEALGLDWRANALRAGLVACTGATGCKFAAAHTKEHALESRRISKRAWRSTRRSISI